MDSKKVLIILVVLSFICSFLMNNGSEIIKIILPLMLGIPILIWTIDKYAIKREIKKQEVFFDICAVILAVEKIAEAIIRIINY